jgi:hypothetical protein
MKTACEWALCRFSEFIFHILRSFLYVLIPSAFRNNNNNLFSIPEIHQTGYRIHLSSHTNKCTSIIYYLKSVLILDIKTLYSLIDPTCFDTTHVIIREHSFS